MNYPSTTFKGLALAAGFATSMLLITSVQAETSSDNWNFSGQVYIWGAGIDATTAAGDDLSLSFSDIIDNLDMTFMGSIAAQKDKVTLFADLIYMDLSDSTNSTVKIFDSPLLPGFKARVKIGLESYISTFGAAYRVFENDTTDLNVLAGARYLWLEAKLDIDTSLPTPKHRISESGHNWDGVVGMRGKTDLSDKWYLTYYGDVGAGDSDLTWQAAAGLNYRFDKVDAAFGYRYLDWEFDNTAALSDLTIDGPYAGVRFAF